MKIPSPTVEAHINEPAFIKIFRLKLHLLNLLHKKAKEVEVGNNSYVMGCMALMQLCTASMFAIMKLTKHGVIIPTHTPCLVIANMADMEAVWNCISTWFHAI